MSIERHGLAIGIERSDNDIYLTLQAVGKLTHADYQVITPMIDSALAEVPEGNVCMLVDATELKGWEARAAWDDFKLGLRHGRQFDRVAIIGNQKWQERAAKIGSWFMSGEVKYFDDRQEAQTWLAKQ